MRAVHVQKINTTIIGNTVSRMILISVFSIIVWVQIKVIYSNSP
jgi:hypothetical protein